MNEIIPAVIPQNLHIVREKFLKVLGLVPKVQIDIVDGHYAPPVTWPFAGDQHEERVKMIRGEEKFPYINDFLLEVDLLLFHPIEIIPDFLSIGAKSFVVHIDSTDHVSECIETIKNAQCDVGLGLKPSGDISLVEQYLMEIGFVQFMGNDRVGYNGVEIDPSVYDKISEFHKRHPTVAIQIDIGVSEGTIPKLKKAGVKRFISGSAIFTAPDTKEAIERLRNL